MPRKSLSMAIALAMAALPAAAQITTDGSVGARATLAGPRYSIADSLGLRVGRNLLHSFTVFNVRTGETATFLGPRGIENIIARITGGSPSTIDGTLQVTAPDASLFLVNPSGIVFGPGASINVPGSFHASTAHTLRLSDGTLIDMRAASPVTLTAAPPSAFGFESAGAAITLTGSQLRVNEGQRIGLVAGDVSLAASSAGRASSLTAASGSIGIVATRGAGSVAIDADRLTPTGFAQMGSLTLSGGSSLRASEGTARTGGGTIVLRGGDVTLDHAIIDASTRYGTGRAIDIGATGRLSLDASNVVAVTTGAGNAGSVRLEARDVAIANGSLVDTSCDPGCTTGNGGALAIVASGGLAITGANPLAPTYVVSNSFGHGANGPIAITTGGALTMSGAAFIQGVGLAGGDGSSITLHTGSIDISGGAQVDASTRSSGHGGNIVVDNAGSIRVDGTRRDPSRNNVKLPSGFFVNTTGTGAAGSIVISTATLEVLNGAEIASNALSGSAGAGGRVELHATGLVRVAGTDSEFKPAGIVANTFGSGLAGTIDLTADRVEVANLGTIGSQSEGAGNANTIRIRARELAISGQGHISSDARSTGNGGAIDVAVTGALTIEGGGSGIFAKTYGPARGGSITVSAGDIAIDGGGLFTQTDGTGAGGNIDVSASGSITIRNAAESGSGISAAARNTGDAVAPAGNITLRAGDALRLYNSPGGISTTARALDGGNIAITVGRFAFLDGSTVAAEVRGGLGAGGNLSLAVPTLVLRGSVLSANAYGGPGGNIHIGTTTLFQSADSSVTASSRLGIDGLITLDSPALNPTGQLLAPAPVFLDAGAILAGRCGARLAGRASSLVIAPRGDATPFPDELRPILDGFTAGFIASSPPPSISCERPNAMASVREVQIGS